MFKRVRTQRAWNSKMAGKPWKVIDNAGYLSAKMLGATRRAHRVIWKLMTGDEPTVIDHINGDRSDNRWTNLRATDWTGNSTNQAISSRNTSGHIGVGFRKDTGRYVAGINHRGTKFCLGSFETIEGAIAARKEAERKLGFHPNHGRQAA